MMVDFFKSSLPLFLGKKVIYKSISERSVELFDRHCGRLRYDFVKRIKETAQKFSSQVEEKLNQTIDTIKDILNTALQKQNDEQRQNEINKIDNHIKSLSEIRANLENLKNQLTQEEQNGKF